MSNQKFTAIEREAIWLAYDKKCAYTRELIDISNFHIDHILPESLADDQEYFSYIKDEYGLFNDFELLGMGNILPCKPGVNLQKGDLVLNKAAIHFYLSLAESKIPVIKTNIDKINKTQLRGKSVLLLQRCLERHEISVEEVSEIIEKYSEQPEDIFHLIEALPDADESEIRFIARADIEELKDRAIKFGQNEHIDGIYLKNDKNEKVFVRTCREYSQAIDKGFYALTTFEIKMSVFFEHQCGLLDALVKAKQPSVSFISDPKTGITDLHLLPISLFPVFGEAESCTNDIDIKTYQDRVNNGTLIIKRVKQNLLLIEEPEGMGQQLVEVLRADFNDDGIEDILIYEYCYATHGTLGYGRIFTLTRMGPNHLFEELP